MVSLSINFLKPPPKKTKTIFLPISFQRCLSFRTSKRFASISISSLFIAFTISSQVNKRQADLRSLFNLHRVVYALNDASSFVGALGTLVL